MFIFWVKIMTESWGWWYCCLLLVQKSDDCHLGLYPKPMINEAQVVRNAIFLNTNSMLGGVCFAVEISYPVLRRNTWVRMEAIWVAMVSPWSLVVLAGYGAPPRVVAAAEPVDTAKIRRTLWVSFWNFWETHLKLNGWRFIRQSPTLLVPKHHLLVHQISGVPIASGPDSWWNVSGSGVVLRLRMGSGCSQQGVIDA